ncbi:hypothetical protein ACVBIL_11430 [Shewanella sp. 125m-7]
MPRLIKPKQNSKITLAIMLVLFICQFFAASSTFSVQYPNGEHPFGQAIYHHHNHDVIQSLNAHSHAPSVFNATESITAYFVIDDTVGDNSLSHTESNLIADHEHANHGHTPSDLPAESHFSSQFIHSDTVKDDEFHYLNNHYAPPIPPPHGQ